MPSSFRYWGISATSRADGTAMSSSNGISLGNIEFASTYNGPNLAYGLPTYTNGAYNNGATQNQAFDGGYGNSNHTWDGKDHNAAISTDSLSTIPIIIWCDFGTPKTIVRCAVTAAEEIYGGAMPSGYSIVGSNDATNWTTVWTTPAKTAWRDLEPHITFDPSYTIPSHTGTYWGAHQYWRIIWGTSSDLAGNNVSLTQLQFRASVGGPSQQTGGTAIGLTTYYTGGGGSPPATVFDGVTSDFCATSGSNSYSGWIGYNHAAPVSVAEVAITARGDGYPQQAPRTALVQWSDDGTSWTTAWAAFHLGSYVSAETFAVAEQALVTRPGQGGSRCGYFTLSATPPTAAYSLRRLGNYTGPLVRVSVPNTLIEADIGSDAYGILDAAAVSAVQGSASALYVTRWYDQSGNGYHAGVLPGSSNYPTLSTVNGRATVFFASSALDAFGYGFATGPFTAIGMVNLTQTYQWPVWLDNPTSNGSGCSLGYSDGSIYLDIQINGNNDIRGAGPAVTNTPHVVSWASTAGIVSGAINPYGYFNGTGGQLGNIGGYGTPLTRLRLGQSWQNQTANSGDRFGGGHMGEVLIWNSVISDRVQVEQRIAQWFGVTAVAGQDTVAPTFGRHRRIATGS